MLYKKERKVAALWVSLSSLVILSIICFVLVFLDAGFNIKNTLSNFPLYDLLLWIILIVPWVYFIGFFFGYKALLGFEYKNSASYAFVIGYFSALFICLFVIFLIHVFFSLNQCLPISSVLGFCWCTIQKLFKDFLILGVPFVFSLLFSLIGAFLAQLALYRYRK